MHFAFCSLPDCADLLHPLELSALHSTHEKLWSAIMQWIRLQHSSICIIAFALKQMNCTLVRFIFCEFHSSKYCCRFADNMPMNSLCKWIKKKRLPQKTVIQFVILETVWFYQPDIDNVLQQLWNKVDIWCVYRKTATAVLVPMYCYLSAWPRFTYCSSTGRTSASNSQIKKIK